MFYLFTSLSLLPYYISYLFTILTFYFFYLITFLYHAVSFILSAR